MMTLSRVRARLHPLLPDQGLVLHRILPSRGQSRGRIHLDLGATQLEAGRVPDQDRRIPRGVEVALPTRVKLDQGLTIQKKREITELLLLLHKTEYP